jgi:hypothetical protein
MVREKALELIAWMKANEKGNEGAFEAIADGKTDDELADYLVVLYDKASWVFEGILNKMHNEEK